MVPHLVGSAMILAFGESLLSLRILNTLLGCVNAGVVYLLASRRDPRLGLPAGLLFAVFPVAAVFDVLALQDTLALTFMLLSLLLYGERLFWSGLALGLAAQSRAEYALASLVIVSVILLRERADTKFLPLLFGWLTVMLGFGWHMYLATGNPLNHLSVSLYSIFASRPAGGDASFLGAMLGWIGWKLSVWPTKPTGIAILCCVAAAAIVYRGILTRRMENYSTPLFFVTVLAVFAPIFVTYIGSDEESLLVMLRAANPVAAFGIVHASHFLARFKAAGSAVLLLLVLASAVYTPQLADKYAYFESKMVDTFMIADDGFQHYDGGRVVCDYPAMNYRLVTAWNLDSDLLAGNHYSPSFRGSRDPREYAAWLRDRDVRLWVKYDLRSDAVWSVLHASHPKVFVFCCETDGIEFYRIDAVELRKALG